MGAEAAVSATTSRDLQVYTIPIPFPGDYCTLCAAAVKGASVGPNAVCSKCGARGNLVFTSRRVHRGIVWPKDGVNVFEHILIPLACCQGCKSHLRVLPQEIPDLKRFCLPSVEAACRAYVSPAPDGPGLRRVRAQTRGEKFDISTLHRWLGGIGDQALDRSRPAARKTSTAKPHPQQSGQTAALVTETARRLGRGVKRLWERSYVIPSWKHKSERRGDQLEACARLLAVASSLFPGSAYPLTAWRGWLIAHVYDVVPWTFPTGLSCTAMQLTPTSRNRIPSEHGRKKPGKGVRYGPRSPPRGDVEV